MDKDGAKIYAYLWVPVFMALAVVASFSELGPCALAALIPLGFFEALLLMSIRAFPKESNREVENAELLQYMVGMGYTEMFGEAFKVQLMGFDQEPVNVRTLTGVSAVMKEGYREEVPNRFIFFTVGDGETYLLVGDRLDEKYRMFCK